MDIMVLASGPLDFIAMVAPAYERPLAEFLRGVDARESPHQTPPRNSHIAMQIPTDRRLVRGL
jgi:hypothetical protein